MSVRRIIFFAAVAIVGHAIELSAATPLVIVEVATFERQSLPETTLAHDLKQMLEKSNVREFGLIRAIKQWETGTKEMPLLVDTVRVKTELGTLVDIETERILAPDPRDEREERPDTLLELTGMEVRFRSQQMEDGAIELKGRFSVLTHGGRAPDHAFSEETLALIKQEVGVRGLQRRIGLKGMTSTIRLRPGEPFVCDGLRNAEEIDGEVVSKESVWVYLVRFVKNELPGE